MLRIVPVLVVLFVLPTVHADDPGLSVPETQVVVDAAEAGAEAQVAATTTMTSGVFWETSQAINEAQAVSFPGSRLEAAFGHVGDFGAATVLNARATGTAGIAWTTDAALTKVDEVEAILEAGDQVVAAGIDAVGLVTEAVLRVLCSQPVDPTACGDESLVGVVQAEVEALLGRGQEEAGQERFGATQQAALRLVASVVPLP